MPKAMKPQWSQLAPLYTVIFLGFFGYALTVALYIPLLSDISHHMLASSVNSSTRVMLSGLLLAMYPLGQFIGSPIIGHLADHYGQKKVLMISLLLCFIGFIAISLSITYNLLTLLFISSFLTGSCESNMAIAQSVIAHMTPDEKLKTKLIGYAFSACSLGYISGPLVGGLTGATHMSFAFWLTSFSLIPITMWIWISLKINSSVVNKEKLHLLQACLSFKTIFTERKLTNLYLINFAIFFAIQGLYRVVPLYVQDIWHPDIHIFTSLIALVSLLCFLANLFLMGPLAKYFNLKSLLMSLLTLSGLFALLVVMPTQFHWIWLTYGLAAIPTVMALTTATTWLSNQASHAIQGQVLGNNQALLVLGEASSAAIGELIAGFHPTLPTISMGIILLLTTFFILIKKQN